MLLVSHSCLTLWIIARQAPLSLELSRQEYWRGLLFVEHGLYVSSRCWRHHTEHPLAQPGVETSSNTRKINSIFHNYFVFSDFSFFLVLEGELGK